MKVISSVFIVLAVIFALSLVEQKACNPKGSLAAKINWAGHKECK